MVETEVRLHRVSEVELQGYPVSVVSTKRLVCITIRHLYGGDWYRVTRRCLNSQARLRETANLEELTATAGGTTASGTGIGAAGVSCLLFQSMTI